MAYFTNNIPVKIAKLAVLWSSLPFRFLLCTKIVEQQIKFQCSKAVNLFCYGG